MPDMPDITCLTEFKNYRSSLGYQERVNLYSELFFQHCTCCSL